MATLKKDVWKFINTISLEEKKKNRELKRSIRELKKILRNQNKPVNGKVLKYLSPQLLK